MTSACARSTAPPTRWWSHHFSFRHCEEGVARRGNPAQQAPPPSLRGGRSPTWQSSAAGAPKHMDRHGPTALAMTEGGVSAIAMTAEEVEAKMYPRPYFQTTSPSATMPKLVHLLNRNVLFALPLPVCTAVSRKDSTSCKTLYPVKAQPFPSGPIR
jgi:hypothetical protein